MAKRPALIIPAPAAFMPSPWPTLPAPAVPYPDPIPGLIPFGSVTIFAGATGSGKTTMAVPWIESWLHGGTICGYPTSAPTRLVWITADRPADETAEWFERQGLDTSEFTCYSILDDRDFPAHLLKLPSTVGQAFDYCLSKTNPPPGSLVIFDPLTPLFVMGDGNKARDVALTLFYYTRRCIERQMSLICTGHFGKQKGKQDDRYARPQDRIAGSNAFGGYSSTQIYLLDPEGPTDAQVWTLGWVPRHGPACQFTFMRDQNGFFVQVEDQPKDTPEATDAAQAALLRMLPEDGTAVSFSDICNTLLTAHGIARSTTYKYRKSLVEQDEIVGYGRGKVKRSAANITRLGSEQKVRP